MIIRSQNGVENNKLTRLLITCEESVSTVGFNGEFNDSAKGGGNTITAIFYPYGITAKDTSIKKFGSSSYNGSNGAALEYDGFTFNVGVSPFTIDYWGYSATANDLPSVLMNDGSVNRILVFGGASASKINITYNSTNLAVIPGSPDLTPYSTWNHYALVRTGGSNYSIDDYLYFKNGTLVNSTNWDSGDFPTDGILDFGNIPLDITLNSGISNWKIDEFRITKGKALWTRNFTPPNRAN